MYAKDAVEVARDEAATGINQILTRIPALSRFFTET
jgi:hypothetical protein